MIVSLQSMTRREIYDKVVAAAATNYDRVECGAVAERLCADLYGFGRFDVVMNGEAVPDGFDVEHFEVLLGRVAMGEPVQYIVGSTEFYGRRFVVREGVLVPRPETEELVALIVRENMLPTPRIVDLCTGTGAIAVSLACEIAGARVDAVDLSPIAIEVAGENIRANGVDVALESGDIFEWEPERDAYDVIVSNPPYIPESERMDMDRNVVDFEPDMALFVPDDSPLVFYERIADVALVGLHEGGRLYFEIHERFAEECAQMLRAKGFEAVCIHNDMNSKPRMVVCTKRV
ncbi:MAG: peptide chain release factor N(5)-glutamine methyltransferase [Tidjanibacter sp.]|nr:peptide chain release factor N(5)-glutamine methyltransferase [Tidjanibacter sp.]